MSKDFEQYEASEFAHLFNYFDEVLPAKTDFIVEAKMITKLMSKVDAMTLRRATKIVNDIVHVAQHFTVKGQI